MVEGVLKNMWLLLTVVMPGLFTYGAWRAILILEPSARLPADAFAEIDQSALVTASIIAAVALVQQAGAIAVEAGLAALASKNKQRWPNFHRLFCERFALAAAGKLDESATRILANFFLSLNMCFGIALLLLYFAVYEPVHRDTWVPAGLALALVATIITTAFRMQNAKWAVAASARKNA